MIQVFFLESWCVDRSSPIYCLEVCVLKVASTLSLNKCCGQNTLSLCHGIVLYGDNIFGISEPTDPRESEKKLLIF